MRKTTFLLFAAIILISLAFSNDNGSSDIHSTTTDPSSLDETEKEFSGSEIESAGFGYVYDEKIETENLFSVFDTTMSIPECNMILQELAEEPNNNFVTSTKTGYSINNIHTYNVYCYDMRFDDVSYLFDVEFNKFSNIINDSIKQILGNKLNRVTLHYVTEKKNDLIYDLIELYSKKYGRYTKKSNSFEKYSTADILRESKPNRKIEQDTYTWKENPNLRIVYKKDCYYDQSLPSTYSFSIIYRSTVLNDIIKKEEKRIFEIKEKKESLLENDI